MGVAERVVGAQPDALTQQPQQNRQQELGAGEVAADHNQCRAATAKLPGQPQDRQGPCSLEGAAGIGLGREVIPLRRKSEFVIHLGARRSRSGVDHQQRTDAHMVHQPVKGCIELRFSVLDDDQTGAGPLRRVRSAALRRFGRGVHVPGLSAIIPIGERLANQTADVLHAL